MSTDVERIALHKARYPKLTTLELIEKLKEKKVTFNRIDEKKAAENLDDLNYYYKLTVYKRNFKKN